MKIRIREDWPLWFKAIAKDFSAEILVAALLDIIADQKRENQRLADDAEETQVILRHLLSLKKDEPHETERGK